MTLAVLLAGALLGGAALLLGKPRPEPRRVRVETEDRKHPRRR